MKWYSSDIKPKKGRWIIYCWQGYKEDDLQFEIRKFSTDGCGFSYHRCWAYLDIEEFLNGKIVQKNEK